MKDYRLTKLTIIGMIILASVIDIAQALANAGVIGLALNRAITIVGQALFVCWFWLKGVKMTDPHNVITIAISTVLELIPIVDLLPAFIAATIKIILRSRVEDTVAITKAKAAQRQEQQRRMQEYAEMEAQEGTQRA